MNNWGERSVNIVASLIEHLELPEYMSFTPEIWVTSDKLKSVNKNQDNLQFEDAIYRLFSERSNITALFDEHLEFSE